jgi:folate-binding protein YgfZ
MSFFKTTKKVLSLHNQPEKFLNGLTANSLDKPHNAFVNLHGRIIATFDQVKVNDDQFLLVIEENFMKDVIDHLDRFARLSKVEIKPVDFAVYFDLDGSYVPGKGEFAILQKHGQLLLTNQNLAPLISETEFTLFRLKNNIPLLGVDYKDEMLLNVSEEDFVSFTKGCFLGQEPIAKVHHRSRPTWKLVVKAEDECTPEEKAKMTSKTTDPQTGKTLGFVFIANK